MFCEEGSIGTDCSDILPRVDEQSGFHRQEAELITLVSKAGYTVAGIWKETASGSSKIDRQQRQQGFKLAQARKIDLVLGTELARWICSIR
ncbi:hypothetical protein ACNSPD_04215 [Yersinia enterocolitica]|uniref:hypothetical protein n=1 Tax=Yersinia TaxID=629 RepID=UPI003AB7BB21